MALFEKTGHHLAAEFEKVVDEIEASARARVETVEHRLAELESEHKVLGGLLKRLGL